MEKIKYYTAQRYFDENGKLHRNSGPAVVYRNTREQVSRVDYYSHGEHISTVKFSKGKVTEKIFNSEGLTKIKYKNDIKKRTKETIFTYHNGNSISEKSINDGEVIYITYRNNGRLHRDQSPAVIIVDNKRGMHYQLYYKYNRLHNSNGPARIVYSYFDDKFELEEQEYYFEGKKVDDFSYFVKLGSSKKNTYKFQEERVD